MQLSLLSRPPMKLSRVLAATAVLMTINPCAHAAMRCANGIISEGDSTSMVSEKCGEPDSNQRISPVIGANGRPPDGSVTVENWVYGPDNGASRYLKFIDGKLVKIETRR
ncbi:DUF2845 domain-containing protein [Pseudomonas sp. EL_65y_Pfl2_R95]|uniref:DUF2845 domain-containing protein n=1 Tax=Pseudomonas sp. EL_65y_Pfl2_R95 TaxID=3088698 RepID=UPI0030D7365C